MWKSDVTRMSGGWPALVVAGASLLGACTPPPPPPDAMARTTLQTAPADLQLLCANSAAGVAGANAKVLPTGSRLQPDGTFAVDLDAAGRKFSCIVDNNGTVRSVTPVT